MVLPGATSPLRSALTHFSTLPIVPQPATAAKTGNAAVTSSLPRLPPACRFAVNLLRWTAGTFDRTLQPDGHKRRLCRAVNCHSTGQRQLHDWSAIQQCASRGAWFWYALHCHASLPHSSFFRRCSPRLTKRRTASSSIVHKGRLVTATLLRGSLGRASARQERLGELPAARGLRTTRKLVFDLRQY
ncbi:putative CxxxxCH...CXXCH cytochrome family protein [Sinorhizobium americanum]|uniref:Putative CxxxxCH...CXXCH cytochrome family protein n=1 Tax=Sinorhizobium americanum TaxID=194963 RepID=A0A4R2B969_9HYPH|nr:putative CxxxxCH...CXXCH cytochrome family protein [Sinorhizobium americanum]